MSGPALFRIRDLARWLPDTHELTGADNLQVNLSQEISCTSAGSFPVPTFRWYIDTREVTADAVTISSETDVEGDRGEVVNATSILTYSPSREDHGRSLVCKLSLSVSPSNTTVLNSSVILDIHYPAIIFRHNASTNWNGESCTASLSCSSEANPPVNHFRWVKVGAERVFNSSQTPHFIHAPDGGLDDNERIGALLIEDVQASDYGLYQCIAYDEDGERNLTSATLSLLKPSKGKM
ncbi:cell adhesion molecule 3-like [Diadema setosum]|uniref:cell adhesion molecule 3-like n=1 Tax=Diadema setosum TaxID=31175 RepID=UPI003B3A9A4B